MHRDLRLENFLFVDQKEESLLKTIDFGLSIFFKLGESFTNVVGSRHYVAPEVLRKRYGPESDTWSAGVIVYILHSGASPFWDSENFGNSHQNCINIVSIGHVAHGKSTILKVIARV